MAVAPSEPVGLGLPVGVPAEPLPPGEVPVPLPSGEPPPWVLPPPDACPPVSTVELTCMIAWRNGVTANAMLAINTTPATTTSGRTQPSRVTRRCLGAGRPAAPNAIVSLAPDMSPAGCGSRRSRGQERELSQASAIGQRSEAGQRTEAGHCSEAGHCRVPGHCSAAGHCTAAGRYSAAGQAQCPRHTQYRARSNAPLTTLSSHG